MKYEGFQFPNCGYPSELQFAYLAGIIDGEGCVMITRCKIRGRDEPWYGLTLSITQKNKNDIEILKKIFGGRIGSKGKSKAWSLTWTSVAASVMLVGILPYVRWKTEQVQLALRFFHDVSTYSGKPFQDKEIALSMRLELQRMKREKYGRK